MRSSRTLAQHCHLRRQIDSGFVIRFLFSFFIDAFVACAYTNYAIVLVVKHRRTGKLREDVYAGFLTFLSQPGSQSIKRDNVVTMILQRRRRR